MSAARCKTVCWHKRSTDAKILGDKGEDLSIFSRIVELTGGERPEKQSKPTRMGRGFWLFF